MRPWNAIARSTTVYLSSDVVNEQVDASIIGGFMVDVGEKHVDLSVKTKVQKYRTLLAESL